MKFDSSTQRLHAYIVNPKQVIIIDAYSRNPAKHYLIRPITLALVIILAISGSVWSGIAYQQKKISDSDSYQRQHLHMQQQLEQLQNQLAAADANNEVKQAQILSLKSMSKQQQELIHKSSQRLHVFESILQARKNQGTSIVQANVTQLANAIDFSLTLVKGGNYPRNMKGSIRFITQDKQGNEVALLFKNGKSRLPFHMENHIFLQGQLRKLDSNTAARHINDITAIISNNKGKELTRQKCTLKDF